MLSLLRVYSRLTRAYMSLVTGLAAVVGLVLSVDATVSWRLGISVFFGQSIITAAGFAVNDVTDAARDCGHSTKPIPNGQISVRSAIWVFAWLSVAGLLLMSCLGPVPFTIAVLQLIICVAYGRIKMFSGALANVTTGLLCSSAFLVGAASTGHIGLSWVPAILGFMFIVLREILKDVLDMDIDKKSNLPTVPLRYGIRATTWIIVQLSCALVILLCILTVFSGFGTVYRLGTAILMAGLVLCIAPFIRQPGLSTASSALQGSGLLMVLLLAMFFLR